MNLKKVEFPEDLDETLTAIYKKLKKIEPGLSESNFLERILREWLKRYKRPEYRGQLTRDNTVLKNDLKKVFNFSGRTQTEVAKEIGVNRVYLGQVISGKYEPSITLALLLSNALGCSTVEDMFYLEPAPKE